MISALLGRVYGLRGNVKIDEHITIMLITSGVPGGPQVWHMKDQSIEERRRQYGYGSCEPAEPVVAGEFVILTFQFVIGQQEISEGGRLRIAWRWPFDWGDLQTSEPGGAGYMTHTTQSDDDVDDCILKSNYRVLGDLNPWTHHIELKVIEGSLREGDRINVTCGDRSGGGVGWRAPTFAAKTARFLMLTDPDSNDRWVRHPDEPAISIVPGSPCRLVAMAPSDAVAGETFDIIVRPEDEWGNASALKIAPQLNDLEAADVCFLREPPTYRFQLSLEDTGTQRLTVSSPEVPQPGETNPIRIHSEPPAMRVFWGDLHSGQTEFGCGAGTPEEHYAVGRDAAALQFITHQANDHYVTLEDWAHFREVTEDFHEPGRYVTFLGCEWSPPTHDGGDRNVIYRCDEPRMRRSGRFFTETEPDPEPDLPVAPAFHEAMRGEQVLLNLHVGGRPTNLDWHAPEIEPLFEIHSTHGTSEWFVHDALSRGYKTGITAGTDGVMTRPGADHPGSGMQRNLRSGLTAVYTPELTRDALWEAFQKRRCYATTGERILLRVDVDEHPMGDEFSTTENPLIRLSVEGTAAIESIDLFCGTEILHHWDIAAASNKSDGMLRILWGGTEAMGTAQAQRVTWDGSLNLSGGSISEVRRVGFQCPDQFFRLETPQSLSWRSITAGNRAGLVMKADGDDSSSFQFSSGPCSFNFVLGEVMMEPKLVECGGVNRHVLAGPAPNENGPLSADLSYQDSRDLEGVFPYWVRVTQIDQARAWSSPVFVTRSKSL